MRLGWYLVVEEVGGLSLRRTQWWIFPCKGYFHFLFSIIVLYRTRSGEKQGGIELCYINVTRSAPPRKFIKSPTVLREHYAHRPAIN